jgi:hypothetical protein
LISTFPALADVLLELASADDVKRLDVKVGLEVF